MLKKRLVLIALVGLGAFGALPKLAVADPEIELNGHTTFTVSGGAAGIETAKSVIACSSLTGSGNFENSQAGTVGLSYHGCKSSGFSCTSPGQASGTVATAELPFRVKSATEGKLALLLTPKATVTSFSCGGLLSVVITGNGVVGLVTSPGYGEESSTATLKFSGEKGVQADKAVDGEETEYSLRASINGGTAEPASLTGESTLTFEGPVKPDEVKTLTVNIAPAGSGTVKSSPVGIHCVILCRSVFFIGTKVKLEVTEFATNFKGWKLVAGEAGTCVNAVKSCEVTLSKDVDLQAEFK